MRGLARLSLPVGAVLSFALAFPIALSGGGSPVNRSHAEIAPIRQPLAFEPDAGRYGHGLSYLSRRDGYALGLMRDGSTVLSSGRARVTTSLVGARPHPVIRAESQLPGRVNSYIGNDRRRWRTGLPTYGAVRYA